jgi:hypothetical protein
VEFAQGYTRGMASKDDSEKPTFVRKALPKDEVYDMWLAQIDKIESSTISTNSDDMVAVDNSLNVGFRLFPIIDSVSFNLFGKNGRHYLKKLGYSDLEADLMYSMFRNGQLHNTSTYRLVYDDGEIGWGLMSSSGSGGFTPHDPGYVSEEYPEDNIPADKAFEYKAFEGNVYHASLQLDRLAMHVKYDLEQKKAADTREEIEFIIGQRIKGKMRKPSE